MASNTPQNPGDEGDGTAPLSVTPGCDADGDAPPPPAYLDACELPSSPSPTPDIPADAADEDVMEDGRGQTDDERMQSQKECF